MARAGKLLNSAIFAEFSNGGKTTDNITSLQKNRSERYPTARNTGHSH